MDVNCRCSLRWQVWAATFALISRHSHYSQFIPVRRKRSERPEVFGFRIIAGTVGSFAITDKVRNAQSLAFIDGVPIFERFFLGDEFSIRGYNVRHISPLAPLDTFITSRNVVIATNPTETPVPVPGLPASLASIGVFTGVSGSNMVQLPRFYNPIGGDTQVLGNFEYRIPIIGNTVGLAAFADIGSAFNLRGKNDQLFSSNFLTDQPFLSTVGVIRCARSPQAGCLGELVDAGSLQRQYSVWPRGSAPAVFRASCCAIIVWSPRRNLITRATLAPLIRSPACPLVSSKFSARREHKPTR